jgi:hypothetical protein
MLSVTNYLSGLTGSQLLFIGGASAAAVRLGDSNIVKHTVAGPLGIAAAGSITSGLVGWFIETEETRKYLGLVILGSTAVCVTKSCVVNPLLRKLGWCSPAVETRSPPSSFQSLFQSHIDKAINVMIGAIFGVVSPSDTTNKATTIYVPEITTGLIRERASELAGHELRDEQFRISGSSGTIATCNFSRCKKLRLVSSGKVLIEMISRSASEGEGEEINVWLLRVNKC